MADLGTDLSCITDCTDDMAEVTGRLCLAQSIARRYITPRGRLIDDPNYGFDLTQYLNDDLSQSDIAKIQAGAQAEAKKDERVLAAKVGVILTAGVMIVTCALEDSDGPFNLVLSVSEVTAQILSVSK